MTIKVLHITPAGDIREVIIEPSLDAFQELVGGYIEGIYLDGFGGYCNEEGKLEGLPFNPIADVFARQHGWEGLPGDILVGPVVFFGGYDDEGECESVPDGLFTEAVAVMSVRA